MGFAVNKILAFSFRPAGTPAQGSPYMWPLRWTADVEDKAMQYGSDKVTYQSNSKVWYMLDKNWKRCVVSILN